MDGRNRFFICTAASLGILTSVPGRFAYGIWIALEFALLVAGSSLFMQLLDLAGLRRFTEPFSALVLVFLAALAKQLLVFVSPAAALVLGFHLYFPALSVFLIGSIPRFSSAQPFRSFRGTLMLCCAFSLLVLVLFLFRDVFGYGTLTLPAGGSAGLYELVLFSAQGALLPRVFWASIPGALVLCAGVVSLFSLCRDMFAFVEEADRADNQ